LNTNFNQLKQKLTEDILSNRGLLVEKSFLSRLARPHSLENIRDLMHWYTGSHDAYDVLTGAARGSVKYNKERFTRGQAAYTDLYTKFGEKFKEKNARLPATHPERFENAYQAETGNPHVHTPARFVPTIFDRTAAYATVRSDPARYAGGSTDPVVHNKVVDEFKRVHNVNEKIRQKAHDKAENEKIEDRKKDFSSFVSKKVKSHLDNIQTTQYDHPLTQAKRIADRDLKLYRSVAGTLPKKLQKYKHTGDFIRGMTTWYVSPTDSAHAKVGNIFGHHLRSARIPETELSPSGVSEPMGSGDSTHAPS
jgi:hypothetical protein